VTKRKKAPRGPQATRKSGALTDKSQAKETDQKNLLNGNTHHPSQRTRSLTRQGRNPKGRRENKEKNHSRTEKKQANEGGGGAGSPL